MQILKDEIKKKILDRVATIFLRHGYSNATVKQIADEAEISVGNIYRYFKNKESILDQLISDFIEELNSFTLSIDSDLFKDATQTLCDRFIDELIALLKKHDIAVKVLVMDVHSDRISKVRDIIRQMISDDLILLARHLNNDKFNSKVTDAIATAEFYGISSIISEGKDFDKGVEDNLRTFLRLTLRNLIFRVKEA